MITLLERIVTIMAKDGWNNLSLTWDLGAGAVPPVSMGVSNLPRGGVCAQFGVGVGCPPDER